MFKAGYSTGREEVVTRVSGTDAVFYTTQSLIGHLDVVQHLSSSACYYYAMQNTSSGKVVAIADKVELYNPGQQVQGLKGAHTVIILGFKMTVSRGKTSVSCVVANPDDTDQCYYIKHGDVNFNTAVPPTTADIAKARDIMYGYRSKFLPAGVIDDRPADWVPFLPLKGVFLRSVIGIAPTNRSMKEVFVGPGEPWSAASAIRVFAQSTQAKYAALEWRDVKDAVEALMACGGGRRGKITVMSFSIPKSKWTTYVIACILGLASDLIGKRRNEVRLNIV